MSMPTDLVNALPENRAPRTTAPLLRTKLGFRDLLLFYIVTTFSLRWMATAAAAGPSALVIWSFAAAGLFVPLVFTTLELSSRYPAGRRHVCLEQATRSDRLPGS